jgi:hypothetical protein
MGDFCRRVGRFARGSRQGAHFLPQRPWHLESSSDGPTSAATLVHS